MTIVRGRWFPADVVLPRYSRPWNRCYVLAADTGLYVWRRRDENADWHSPIDWEQTTIPGTERDAKNGFDVHTTAGLVVITAGSGCRCGSLGRWPGPAWSHNEYARSQA